MTIVAVGKRQRFVRPAWCALAVVAVVSSTRASRASEPATDFLLTARAAYLAGRYDDAVAAYRAAADDPKTRPAAHAGWTVVDDECGRYREGLARLDALTGEAQQSADWHSSKALLLERVGEYESAIRHGRRALELNPSHFRARWELGRLLERLGRRGEAVEVFQWFNDLLRRQLPERADDLTFAGRGFHRYSVLTRHENLRARTRYVLQDVYQEAFDVVDATYWPARLAAAELLLEKHNTAEASEDFEKVLAANPSSVAARVGLAMAALEEWNFDAAERHAERALETNPRSLPAWAALGRTRMLERRYDDAAGIARRMLEVNPRSIEGLTLSAVASLRAERREESQAALAELAKFAPTSAYPHHEMGLWLSAARQYEEAEAHFKRAIELDPTWPSPRTELGQMYMQTGDESAAREVLAASWELDSFDRQTYGVLELLDELDRFARHDQPNFVLKHDEQDAVIVPYFAAAMERVYAQVTADFRAVPTTQTTVEVFPSHSQFSVRISGRPWIHTVGACTGPVIAMDAPRRSGSFGRFNWARVLRHEFAHTVTLAATGNRIPHWMTEGMAVWAEHAPRSWEWQLLLSEAVQRGHLFTLESIDWGFMRPRRADDRQLAYAQSEWMIEYIDARWGHDAMLALLTSFAARRSTREAFHEALGASPEDFERGFRAWAAEAARTWNTPPVPSRSRRRLRALAAAAPFDVAVRAELAEACWAAREGGEAWKHARRATELSPNHARAARIAAIIAVGRADSIREEDARRASFEASADAIERLARASPDDPDAVRCLAMLEQCRERWDAALALWKRYQGMRPADPDGYRRRAGIFLVTDRADEVLPDLMALHEVADDDPEVCRRIAGILAGRRDEQGAISWWLRALDVDPYDDRTHRELARAYGRLSDAASAERHWQSLSLLPEHREEGHRGLAALYREQGRDREAEEQERLVEQHRAARRDRSK